jgi:putative peptidoglycan lipid II flippase
MSNAVAPMPGALDRALARGMFVVAIFAAISGAARVAQDAAIAWRYGAGQYVDAYYYVLNLVNWPVAVATSTLTLIVAPVYAASRRGEAGAARHFRAELLGAVLLVAVVSLPLAWWALPAISASAFVGLEAGAAALALDGVPAIVAAVPLGLVGALFAAWLVAAGRHTLALLEALPPLVLIAALLMLPGPVLFWGTTMGIALQVAVMALVLRRAGELSAPRVGMSAADWAGFAHGAAVLLAGQMVFALVPLIDPFFAARLGDGAVSALSFASRLVLGLQGLAGLALQRASLPLLSRWMVTSPAAARQAALRWALAAAAVGAVIGVAVAALAEPLVSLLFERGRFTAGDREHVATLLRYGMLQMPPFLGGLALVTALASLQARHHLALTGGVGLALKVGLSAWLVNHHGVVGLLLATALMYTATALMAWGMLVRQSARKAG